MPSATLPARSISLPSRPHPNSLKIEAALAKLKIWKSSAVPGQNSPGAEDIQMGLTRLAELFNCMEDLIYAPLSRLAFQHHHSNVVEKALDGSVELLDVCSTSRDLLLSMKEHLQDMQSALRRRGINSIIESNVRAYSNFRKKAKINIAKSLRLLKRIESNVESFLLLEVDHPLNFVLEVTREANAYAISIFRALMLFLSGPVTTKSTGGWSLISRLIRSGSLASDRCNKIINEVEIVDIALCSFHGRIWKNDAKIDVQELQGRLETLEIGIGGLETVIDSMFRCLIQNRVSLLNLITA